MVTCLPVSCVYSYNIFNGNKLQSISSQTLLILTFLLLQANLCFGYQVITMCLVGSVIFWNEIKSSSIDFKFVDLLKLKYYKSNHNIRQNDGNVKNDNLQLEFSPSSFLDKDNKLPYCPLLHMEISISTNYI